jgi:aryl-alcohol dehydrogenase-like predicted oxidoreductase
MAQLFPARSKNDQPAQNKTESAASPAAGQNATSPSADLPATRPVSIVARRRVGESTLAVFPLALGGSAFGWTADTETATRTLDRFADLGGNLVSTADSYSGGRSERIIGDWLRRSPVRDRIMIATKVGRSADNPGLGPVSMVRAVEASLTRLGRDHIDILGFNGDDVQVPLEESLATAEWLIDSGKVRYLALAGYSAERLIEARILAATGLPKVIAIEAHYNLMHRAEFEGDLRIVASAQSLAVLPAFPLASGFLTGKYRSKTDVGTTVRGARAGEYLSRRGLRVIAALEHVAHAHDASVASIALAWLLAKRNVVAPVASATLPEHVDDLMAAAGIRLTRSQMLELDRVS